MKILEIPAYFYPEQVASSYLWKDLREAYASEGFQSVVYCPVPSRGCSENDKKKYRYKKEYYLYEGKTHVIRFPLFQEGTNPIMRAFRYMLSAIIQLWYGSFNKYSEDCDIIMVNSTPPIQGALAAFIKKKRHIPFIYNLQDIFPDSLVGTGLAKRGGMFWKIGRRIEDFTYRNADKIIVISESFKQNIIAKGVPEEKIEVIYNWADEQGVVDIPRQSNILFERYGLDRNKFYITYNGNIGLTQNMDMLMEVAKALEANEDIRFVLVGNGAYKDKLEKIINERSISNVTLLPFQPYEDISHVFSLGDVSLVISKPGVGENSVPSKTWNIMSAARPVLANFDENELKTIIEDNHCGVFTKSGDKVAFADAILKLYHNRELCKEMGKNGRKFVMKNLTKKNGTQKYIEVIKCFEK